jgi:hypothetical protein
MEEQDNTLRTTCRPRDWYNDQYYGVDYDIDMCDEDLDLDRLQWYLEVQ